VTYVPHTDEEISEMLGFLGLESLEQLFQAIPAELAFKGVLRLPPAMSEEEVRESFECLAARNARAISGAVLEATGANGLVCFAGGGAYDRTVPAAVGVLGSRAEFANSYTPYQPEVAQGVLQALFEYQSILTRLSGMEVANASLYDGASALVEAVNLACAHTGRAKVWVSSLVNPSWLEVLATFAKGTGHEIEMVPHAGGATSWASWESKDSGEPPGCVVVAYPNYLGVLEEISQAVSLARTNGALVVMCFDPVAAAVLAPPGQWGADIAVGEGQALGIPLSFGGPYLGLFATKRELLRRIPGRLVGETLDSRGQRAYVTTLRAREQDIRREKASSNVCTNQTLVAIQAAMTLSWLGPRGLKEMALSSMSGARYLRDQLLGIEGVEPLTSAPFFDEFGILLPSPAKEVRDEMAHQGYLAGIALSEELVGNDQSLLVAVTERRTKAEMDGYVAALRKVLS
jgi:glycine dehydrogenase subunit 1